MRITFGTDFTDSARRAGTVRRKAGNRAEITLVGGTKRVSNASGHKPEGTSAAGRACAEPE